MVKHFCDYPKCGREVDSESACRSLDMTGKIWCSEHYPEQKPAKWSLSFDAFKRVRTKYPHMFFLLLALVSLACTSTPKPTVKLTHLTEEISKVNFVCRVDTGVHFRKTAGVDGEVVSVLPNGTEVTLTGLTETPVVIEWKQVRVDGVTGWISSKYLCEVR